MSRNRLFLSGLSLGGATKWVVALLLLLLLGACGETENGLVTRSVPSTQESRTATPGAVSSPQSESSPQGDSDLTTTTLGEQPATNSAATETQISTPKEAGSASAADSGSETELELIGGPGTPLPEDIIVEKDVPTPDVPVTGYTPISSTYDSDGDGFLTGADLVTALRAEYPGYSWPPDYQLDLDAFIVVINEEVEKYNTRYENGMERSMLTRTNLCAWQLDLRDAMYSGDEERIAADIALLRSILSSTSPAFAEIVPYQEDAINKAELGDPGPLQQVIEGGFCEERLWIASPDSDPSTGRIDVLAIRNENFDEMV